MVRLTTAICGLAAPLASAVPRNEADGVVVVEAEHFADTSLDATGNRGWYIQDGGNAGPGPDPDAFHSGAGGNAYTECLSDTHMTHDDPFTPGLFYGDSTGDARLELRPSVPNPQWPCSDIKCC